MAVDRVREFLQTKEVCRNLAGTICDLGFVLISDFGEENQRHWNDAWLEPAEGESMGGGLMVREAHRTFDAIELEGASQAQTGETLYYLIRALRHRSSFDLYVTPEPIDRASFPLGVSPVLVLDVDDSQEVEKVEVYGREVNFSPGNIFDFDPSVANDLQGFVTFFDLVRRQKEHTVELT